MAYGIPEFPAGSMYDSDLSELVKFYKKLVGEYEEFLNRLTVMENRLTELEEHIDEVLDAKLESVYAQMREIKAQIEAVDADLRAEMSRVRQEMNALDASVKAQISALQAYVNQEILKSTNYTNQQIAELRKEVDATVAQLTAEVNNAIKQLDAELRAYVERKLREFDSTLVELDKKIVAIKTYVDQQNSALRKELFAAIEELEQKIVDITVSQVWVRNPVDGVIGNIQDVLDSMWEHLDWWSLTAYEYDRLQLTADEYDNWDKLIWSVGIGLTAEEYDYLAKWYLWEKGGLVNYIDGIEQRMLIMCNACKKEIDVRLSTYYRELVRRTEMFSPWTGTVTEIKDIIAHMFNFFAYGALTAQEYDDLDLTAEEYDNLDLTAYVYDWEGIKAITGTEFLGITAEQYDNLGVQADGHVVYR